jgi:hypothetical protein
VHDVITLFELIVIYRILKQLGLKAPHPARVVVVSCLFRLAPWRTFETLRRSCRPCLDPGDRVSNGSQRFLVGQRG